MSDAGSRAGSAQPDETHQDDEPQQPREAAENEVANDSDKDSDILSEIDEDQFDDFEEERPVEIDQDAAKSLKAAKRKRADGETTTKKPKQPGRPKKRARVDLDDEVDAANIEEGDRRSRKSGATRDKPSRKQTPEEEPEENLTPEERRRRALDKAIDAAIKKPNNRRRKQTGIDLDNELDEEIASLKVRMEQACIKDNDARENGQPAVHKVKLLPEVIALLNRNAALDTVLDPDVNLLQAVRFFLEPLNDGSLPAYSIQRDLFNVLAKLPINKEVLLSSGIGKVVLFYTKSKQPEASIKRIAERLVGEWSRPILRRTDDYKKRAIATRDFDYNAAKEAERQAAVMGSSQLNLPTRPAVMSRTEAERRRLLAPETVSKRAQPAGLPQSYIIAPRSTFDVNRAQNYQPIGAAGTEAFRKMTQKKGR